MNREEVWWWVCECVEWGAGSVGECVMNMGRKCVWFCNELGVWRVGEEGDEQGGSVMWSVCDEERNYEVCDEHGRGNMKCVMHACYENMYFFQLFTVR